MKTFARIIAAAAVSLAVAPATALAANPIVGNSDYAERSLDVPGGYGFKGETGITTPLPADQQMVPGARDETLDVPGGYGFAGDRAITTPLPAAEQMVPGAEDPTVG